MTLIDKLVQLFSSIMYNVFKDGIAMKSNMIAGIEVQNISVLWDSIIN
jgi:hypothetical protein